MRRSNHKSPANLTPWLVRRSLKVRSPPIADARPTLRTPRPRSRLTPSPPLLRARRRFGIEVHAVADGVEGPRRGPLQARPFDLGLVVVDPAGGVLDLAGQEVGA